MKLNFEVIDASQLADGDIFYCTPNYEMNDFGPDHLLTGTDQILIRDDYHDEDDMGNYSIIVNGGYTIWFAKDEKVVRLGHYSDLIRVIEMIKEGNPDMELGPNDITTITHDLMENHPDFFKELPGDLFDED